MDLMHPVLVALLTSARDTARATASPLDFPEYSADGNVEIDGLEADFSALEYVLPGTSCVFVSPDSIPDQGVDYI